MTALVVRWHFPAGRALRVRLAVLLQRLNDRFRQWMDEDR